MLKLLINGAAGKMACELIRTLQYEKDITIVGAVDISHIGEDCGLVAGCGSVSVVITNDLQQTIDTVKPDVAIDFTNASVIKSNIEVMLKNKLNVVVGASGLDEESAAKYGEIAQKNDRGLIVAPNFAIGAVLMMEFSKIAARFMQNAEIIELHHDGKLDSPSGTAIKTAELMKNQSAYKPPMDEDKYFEKIPGARGAQIDNIHIHSVRLPGLIAHQEVIFGGNSEILTIKHDSMNRQSFMPGVVLSIRKAVETKGCVYGLEKILGIS